MGTPSTKGYSEIINALDVGAFATLISRLERGGALQARKLSTGAVQLYWRFSHNGKTSREPIGTYDPLAPPKKLDPTLRGYSIAAARNRCDELAKTHTDRLLTGGLLEVKAEQRKQHAARKQAEVTMSERTLGKLLEAYVAHLKAQERRSHYDAGNIFKTHVELAWPTVWAMSAAEVTPDHVLDIQRQLIDAGKGRTANKVRAYVRAAFQCAIDVRTDAAIPVTFKSFAVVFNPAAQTKRIAKFDKADKRPLTTIELQQYWHLIKHQSGMPGVALRLHLLTGGQRIEQLLRLEWKNTSTEQILIFDGKGRPGQGPREHSVPLVKHAAALLSGLARKGRYVISTTEGEKPISATTMAGWAHSVVGEIIPDFQLKRVRSGVETLLAANGISRDLRGQLQSHGLTGVQARHYDGHSYSAEKRASLELLFAELEGRDRSKVVPIKKRRA